MTTMKLVAGARATTTHNLILRNGPGTTRKWLATIQKDVMVRALGEPANGWVEVEVSGWVSSAQPGKVFSEAHEKSSVKAIRSAELWEWKTFTGHASTRYLKVIDGPTNG